jgi:hypothetical protein
VVENVTEENIVDQKPSPFFSKYSGILRKFEQSNLHWKKKITGQQALTDLQAEVKEEEQWRETTSSSEARRWPQQNAQPNHRVNAQPGHHRVNAQPGHHRANSFINSYNLSHPQGFYANMSTASSDLSLNHSSPNACDDMSTLDLYGQFSLPGGPGRTVDAHSIMDLSPDNHVSSTRYSDSSGSSSQQNSPHFHTIHTDPSVFGNKVGVNASHKRKRNETMEPHDFDHDHHGSRDNLPHSTGFHHVQGRIDNGLCQVCDDVAAGFYCGASVCEACKVGFHV